VCPSDDMEKVSVGSPNDMDVESVGSNGEACFGKWGQVVGSDAETVPDIAR
jgi:hypothetical protein